MVIYAFGLKEREKKKGKVAENSAANGGTFTNSCAVEISRCLNYSGSEIPFIKGETSSGADGKWYIFRVKTLEGHLTEQWGSPDVKLSSIDNTNIIDRKGLIIFDFQTGNGPTGHADLWNGNTCVGECYFGNSRRTLFWELPD